jgi:hypothetical protein
MGLTSVTSLEVLRIVREGHSTLDGSSDEFLTHSGLVASVRDLEGSRVSVDAGVLSNLDRVRLRLSSTETCQLCSSLVSSLV